MSDDESPDPPVEAGGVPGDTPARAILMKPNIGRNERRRLFQLLDRDGNGRLSAAELQYGLLHLLKLPTSRAFVDRIMGLADSDHDGEITEAEFEDYLVARERELEQAFREVDSDGDGSIDLDEMSAGLRRLGHDFSQADISYMMSKVDANGDGRVTMEEFRAFFIHTPLATTQEILDFWRRPALVASDGSVKELLIPPNSTGSQGYVLCSFLDSGAFGEVCLAECQETGHQFAIKRFSVDDARVVEQFHEERDFLSKASQSGSCKKLVAMHEAFVAEDASCLVLTYCPGGNLQNLIDSKVFTPEAAAFYAAEAAEAIREIHALGYVHRDIKAENFLIESNGRLKLCDFGSCLAVDNEEGHVIATVQVGTPDYFAPEFIQAKRKHTWFTRAIDWWALGCLVYDMLYGYLPFESESAVQTETLILAYKTTLRFPPNPALTGFARTFILSLLCDVDDRMAYEQIRAHPFLESVDWAIIDDNTVATDIPAQLEPRTAKAVPPVRQPIRAPSTQAPRPRAPPPKKVFA